MLNRLTPLLRRLISPVDSLTSLVLLGVAAVLVPAVLTLGTALSSLDDVARSGADAAVHARDVVGHARELVERSTAMERHARQRAILDDPQFFTLYLTRREAFTQAITALRALALDPALDARLETLAAQEDAVHTSLRAQSPGEVGYTLALNELAEVGANARGFLGAAEGAVLASAAQIEADTSALRNTLAQRTALMAPLIGVLLIVGFFSVIRPIRRLEAEIRRIGDGALDVPVKVRGPSDVRLLGARLEHMRTQLLQVEADRVRLFRHVSHELKTPLASLREGAQLLAEELVGPLTPEQAEIAAIMTANTALLQRRIEDLLRLSELRTGESALNLDDVDLEDLVRRLVAQHRVTAQGRGLRFELRLQPITAQADAARLPPAIDNLLTNALKVAPKGTAIDVVLREDGPDWRIDVIDRGPGVPEDERERIFEPFYQGRVTRKDYVQGTGIGLTIAREIARAHGGDIALLPNEEGQGTCATLHAPHHVGGTP